MTDPSLIARSRDTSQLEAGMRVVWRKQGSADMYVGSIEVIDNQKPYPVEVLLDNGETVLALADEVVGFPPITPEQVDAYLND